MFEDSLNHKGVLFLSLKVVFVTLIFCYWYLLVTGTFKSNDLKVLKANLYLQDIFLYHNYSPGLSSASTFDTDLYNIL